VKDHAAACRLSAAIAVRCGVLVEALAEPPVMPEWSRSSAVRVGVVESVESNSEGG
jgi:hypothetical protein